MKGMLMAARPGYRVGGGRLSCAEVPHVLFVAGLAGGRPKTNIG